MRPTKRSSSACSSSSAALKPAASRTAASMPLAKRAVRPGPVREPGSAARAEPVRSPRNQADAAPATSACSASVRRSPSESPPSAAISSLTITAWAASEW